MTPEFSAVFNPAMAEGTKVAAPAVIAAGEFGRFGTIADVGGGCGTLLAAISAAHPGLHGIVFDIPRALAGAADVLDAAGVAGRCEQQPGDFFAEVPGGADAYLLKSVIHDWDDARAGVILASCRAAMSPAATLMLIEPVTSNQLGRQAPFPVSYSDLNMLVCTSGRERTEDEFRGLLTAAGFAVRRIAPCPVVLLFGRRRRPRRSPCPSRPDRRPDRGRPSGGLVQRRPGVRSPARSSSSRWPSSPATR
jgi:hypothetical protein